MRIAFPYPLRAACALVVVALVAGCSLTRESPVKQTYVLDAPLPSPGAKTQPASVRVGTITVGAPFRGRNFVYRTGDLSYVNDFYDEFLVAPAALMAEQTARALLSARTFALVLPPGTNADADYVLEGFVSALYSDQRTAGKAAAELTIAYYLTAASGAVPVWTREYHKRIELSAANAGAYSAAINVALGEVLADLARDLAEVDLRKR
jgi:uncharacterized lipoprotein YmbA